MFLVFFLGSAVVVGLTELPKHVAEEAATSIYVISAIVLLAILLTLFPRRLRERIQNDRKAEATLQKVRSLSLARREVKAKIPKNAPKRESPVTREALARLSSARSMAVLVRKPRLREIVLEICDFADLVLETIRRMPEDTPASVAFTENHLVRFQEALERCFEFYRAAEYKKAASIDTETYEIECFSAFIATFCKQQDCILFEGLGNDDDKSILT